MEITAYGPTTTWMTTMTTMAVIYFVPLLDYNFSPVAVVLSRDSYLIMPEDKWYPTEYRYKQGE